MFPSSLKKSVAFSLSLCFLLFECVSYAAPPLPSLRASEGGEAIPKPEIASVATLPRNDKGSTISIPESLGRIEESYTAPSSPTPQLPSKTIIYLQDAHTIYEAQKSIQSLIDYFETRYGINTIALEGGQGRLDPFLFRTYPDQGKLKNVFETYLEKGELSGAVAAAVLNKNEADYYGIEDPRLYEEGALAFLEARGETSRILEAIHRKERGLAQKKEKVYPPKLLRFDQILGAYRDEKLDLAGLLLKLREFKTAEGFPHLEALLKANGEESGPRREEFIRGINKFQAPAFFRELDAYREEIKGSLFPNEEAKKLDRESEAFDLLKRMAKFELTRKDWGELQGDLNSFLSAIRYLLSAHLSFYEIALKREEALFRNLEKLLVRKGNSPLLLVTGGFHTQGITEALKKKGISYVLISPRITKFPEKNPYFQIMEGEVSWKDYFRVEKGRVNLYDAFAQGARDKLLGIDGRMQIADGRVDSRWQIADGSKGKVILPQSAISRPPSLLKRWRDEIIRTLASRGKIEKAKDYTRFIDEARFRSISPEELHTLQTQWRFRVEQFLARLKRLVTQNRLTEENLLRLFKSPASIPAVNVGSAIPGFTVRASLVGKSPRTAVEEKDLGRKISDGHAFLGRGQSPRELKQWPQRLKGQSQPSFNHPPWTDLPQQSIPEKKLPQIRPRTQDANLKSALEKAHRLPFLPIEPQPHFAGTWPATSSGPLSETFLVSYLNSKIHSSVSPSNSAHGRKSHASGRKSASKTILSAFSNHAPNQRTSFTKDQLNRNELTITSALRKEPPHSNLFTRDFRSPNLNTSVRTSGDLIRGFIISQIENYNKSKYPFPPRFPRAEVRTALDGRSRPELSEFFQRSWKRPRKLTPEEKALLRKPAWGLKKNFDEKWQALQDAVAKLQEVNGRKYIPLSLVIDALEVEDSKLFHLIRWNEANFRARLKIDARQKIKLLDLDILPFFFKDRDEFLQVIQAVLKEMRVSPHEVISKSDLLDYMDKSGETLTKALKEFFPGELPEQILAKRFGVFLRNWQKQTPALRKLQREWAQKFLNERGREITEEGLEKAMKIYNTEKKTPLLKEILSFHKKYERRHGTPPPEKEVAERFGASRTTVRKWYRSLAAQGADLKFKGEDRKIRQKELRGREARLVSKAQEGDTDFLKNASSLVREIENLPSGYGQGRIAARAKRKFEQALREFQDLGNRFVPEEEAMIASLRTRLQRLMRASPAPLKNKNPFSRSEVRSFDGGGERIESRYESLGIFRGEQAFDGAIKKFREILPQFQEAAGFVFLTPDEYRSLKLEKKLQPKILFSTITAAEPLLQAFLDRKVREEIGTHPGILDPGTTYEVIRVTQKSQEEDETLNPFVVFLYTPPPASSRAEARELGPMVPRSELRPLEKLTWQDEEGVLAHFRALLAEIGWPLPRVVFKDGRKIETFGRKPLNIETLKELAAGRTPEEYYRQIRIGSDIPEGYFSIRPFLETFGIWRRGVIWFRHPEQLLAIRDYVATLSLDRPVRILVQATWNGEDAYALAVLLQHFFPDRKFEILGKDLIPPDPNELNWVFSENVPEFLKEILPQYFDRITEKVWALKESYKNSVTLAQGDITDPQSFGSDWDLIVANNVLGQSVSEEEAIARSLENVWRALKPGGRFFMNNQSFQAYPEQQETPRDVLQKGLLQKGKFRIIHDGEYEKISTEKTPRAEVRAADRRSRGEDQSGKVRRRKERRDSGVTGLAEAVAYRVPVFVQKDRQANRQSEYPHPDRNNFETAHFGPPSFGIIKNPTNHDTNAIKTPTTETLHPAEPLRRLPIPVTVQKYLETSSNILPDSSLRVRSFMERKLNREILYNQYKFDLYKIKRKRRAFRAEVRILQREEVEEKLRQARRFAESPKGSVDGTIQRYLKKEEIEDYARGNLETYDRLTRQFMARLTSGVGARILAEDLSHAAESLERELENYPYQYVDLRALAGYIRDGYQDPTTFNLKKVPAPWDFVRIFERVAERGGKKDNAKVKAFLEPLKEEWRKLWEAHLASLHYHELYRVTIQGNPAKTPPRVTPYGVEFRLTLEGLKESFRNKLKSATREEKTYWTRFLLGQDGGSFDENRLVEALAQYLQDHPEEIFLVGNFVEWKEWGFMEDKHVYMGGHRKPMESLHSGWNTPRAAVYDPKSKEWKWTLALEVPRAFWAPKKVHYKFAIRPLQLLLSDPSILENENGNSVITVAPNQEAMTKLAQREPSPGKVTLQLNLQVAAPPEAKNKIQWLTDHLKEYADNGIERILLGPGTLEETSLSSYGSPYASAAFTTASYGSAQDLSKLIEEADKLGIEVAFDWVTTHTAGRLLPDPLGYETPLPLEDYLYAFEDYDPKRFDPSKEWKRIPVATWDRRVDDQNPEAVARLLWKLKALGIKVIRADVGGGFSDWFWYEARILGNQIVVEWENSHAQIPFDEMYFVEPLLIELAKGHWIKLDDLKKALHDPLEKLWRGKRLLMHVNNHDIQLHHRGLRGLVQGLKPEEVYPKLKAIAAALFFLHLTHLDQTSLMWFQTDPYGNLRKLNFMFGGAAEDPAVYKEGDEDFQNFFTRLLKLAKEIKTHKAKVTEIETRHPYVGALWVEFESERMLLFMNLSPQATQVTLDLPTGSEPRDLSSYQTDILSFPRAEVRPEKWPKERPSRGEPRALRGRRPFYRAEVRSESVDRLADDLFGKYGFSSKRQEFAREALPLLISEIVNHPNGVIAGHRYDHYQYALASPYHHFLTQRLHDVMSNREGLASGAYVRYLNTRQPRVYDAYDEAEYSEAFPLEEISTHWMARLKKKKDLFVSSFDEQLPVFSRAEVWRKELRPSELSEESLGHPRSEQRQVTNPLAGRDSLKPNDLGLGESHRDQPPFGLRKLEPSGTEFVQEFRRIVRIPEFGLFLVGLKLRYLGWFGWSHRLLSSLLIKPSFSLRHISRRNHPSQSSPSISKHNQKAPSVIGLAIDQVRTPPSFEDQGAMITSLLNFFGMNSMPAKMVDILLIPLKRRNPPQPHTPLTGSLNVYTEDVQSFPRRAEPASQGLASTKPEGRSRAEVRAFPDRQADLDRLYRMNLPQAPNLSIYKKIDLTHRTNLSAVYTARIAEEDTLPDYVKMSEYGPREAQLLWTIAKQKRLSAAHLPTFKGIGMVDDEAATMWASVEGMEKSKFYFITGGAKGENFNDIIRQASAGEISEREALEFIRLMVQAIADFHQEGIAHGDLKPDAIFISPIDKKVTVIDFGIAMIEGVPGLDFLSLEQLDLVKFSNDYAGDGPRWFRRDARSIVLIIAELLEALETHSKKTGETTRLRSLFAQEFLEVFPEEADNLKARVANRFAETPAELSEILSRLNQIEKIFSSLLRAEVRTGRQAEGRRRRGEVRTGSKSMFPASALGLPPSAYPLRAEVRGEQNSSDDPDFGSDVIPPFKVLKVKRWVNAKEIRGISEKYNGGRGISPTGSSRSGDGLHMDLLKKLMKLPVLHLPFDKRLSGTEVLVIGPGVGVSREIQRLLELFPEIRIVHIVEPFTSNLENLDGTLSEFLKGKEIKTEFHLYRTNVLELPAEFEGRIDIVEDHDVFDTSPVDRRFSRSQMDQISREIERVLKPFGLHMSSGNLRIQDHLVSSLPAVAHWPLAIMNENPLSIRSAATVFQKREAVSPHPKSDSRAEVRADAAGSWTLEGGSRKFSGVHRQPSSIYRSTYRAEVRDRYLSQRPKEEERSATRIKEGATRKGGQKISGRVFFAGRSSKTRPLPLQVQSEKLPSSQSLRSSSSPAWEAFGEDITQATEKITTRMIPDAILIRAGNSEETQKPIEEEPANKAKALKRALAPKLRRLDSSIIAAVTLSQGDTFVNKKIHNNNIELTISGRSGRAEVWAEVWKRRSQRGSSTADSRLLSPRISDFNSSLTWETFRSSWSTFPSRWQTFWSSWETFRSSWSTFPSRWQTFWSSWETFLSRSETRLSRWVTLSLVRPLTRLSMVSFSELPWSSTSISPSRLSNPLWFSPMILISLWRDSTREPTSVTEYESTFFLFLAGFPLVMADLLINQFNQFMAFAKNKRLIVGLRPSVVNIKNKKYPNADKSNLPLPRRAGVRRFRTILEPPASEKKKEDLRKKRINDGNVSAAGQASQGRSSRPEKPAPSAWLNRATTPEIQSRFKPTLLFDQQHQNDRSDDNDTSDESLKVKNKAGQVDRQKGERGPGDILPSLGGQFEGFHDGQDIRSSILSQEEIADRLTPSPIVSSRSHAKGRKEMSLRQVVERMVPAVIRGEVPPRSEVRGFHKILQEENWNVVEGAFRKITERLISSPEIPEAYAEVIPRVPPATLSMIQHHPVQFFEELHRSYERKEKVPQVHPSLSFGLDVRLMPEGEKDQERIVRDILQEGYLVLGYRRIEREIEKKNQVAKMAHRLGPVGENHFRPYGYFKESAAYGELEGRVRKRQGQGLGLVLWGDENLVLTPREKGKALAFVIEPQVLSVLKLGEIIPLLQIIASAPPELRQFYLNVFHLIPRESGLVYLGNDFLNALVNLRELAASA